VWDVAAADLILVLARRSSTAQVFSRFQTVGNPASTSPPPKPESTRPASDFVYGSTRRPAQTFE